MRLWRIIYGDLSAFSDAEGTPYDAPRRNVQVIVNSYIPVGRLLMAQKDFYWWDERSQLWFGGDHNGMWDYLDQPGPRVVLFGRYIPNHEYAACVKMALEDPDFAPKNARLDSEVF